MEFIDCNYVQELVRNEETRQIARILGNGSDKLKDCPRLPNAVISLLKGYKESEISEKMILDTFSQLKRKEVFTIDFRERVISLEDFSGLRDVLSVRIMDELFRKY